MNYQIENKSKYSVVTMLSDSLDAHTTPELKSELVILSGKAVKSMIIDLSNCHTCDTSGLSAIMIAHRLCKDGVLVLVGACRSVESMLSIQRFDPPLLLCATIEEGEARMHQELGL